jgi:broad specificity phosphatase PhoE
VEGAWRRIEVLPRPVAIVAHQAVNSVLWRILQGGAEVNFRQAYCEILEA